MNYHVLPNKAAFHLLEFLNPQLKNIDPLSSIQLTLPDFPPTSIEEQKKFSFQEKYDFEIDDAMIRKFISDILNFDKYLRKSKPKLFGKPPYDNLMALESIFTRYMKSDEPPPMCRSVAIPLNDEIESCNSLMLDILLGEKKDRKDAGYWVSVWLGTPVVIHAESIPIFIGTIYQSYMSTPR